MIIFYKKDKTIIFLEICLIKITMLIIIDSSKIDVNHMKIDFYKVITLNKTQVILK